MFSLLLRNLLFTILLPGTVAGFIPYLLLRGRWTPDISDWRFYHLAGAAVFLSGLSVLLFCIFLFAVEGRGTLAPVDPTRRLVAKGPYRYSRNPMYVGVTAMLAGEALFTRETGLWYYLLLVFLLFNVFVFLVEEPRLRRDFGEEYKAYCRRVRRWV